MSEAINIEKEQLIVGNNVLDNEYKEEPKKEELKTDKIIRTPGRINFCGAIYEIDEDCFLKKVGQPDEDPNIEIIKK
ncbi:MAG TPA: hypothetical protein DCP90_04395 [Clostridiales bacterium]|nr:MAG: hypothetical protein A2Y22_06870 [Clostridiales bacterium GWD2_32_59]HAN09835.1 hypothetical protein [Clostridiales bacterium]